MNNLLISLTEKTPFPSSSKVSKENVIKASAPRLKLNDEQMFGNELLVYLGSLQHSIIHPFHPEQKVRQIE